MVRISRYQRYHRNKGFGLKPFTLLAAALILLIVWVFQKAFYDQNILWLFIGSVALGTLSFGMVMVDIWKLWKKPKDRWVKTND